MAVIFSFILAVLPTILVIGAFVVMPRWMKVAFVIYLFFAIRHFLTIGLASTAEEALSSLNYIYGAIGFLVFGGIYGALESSDDRKSFVFFILKYGGAYVALFTLPKIALYWMGMTWSEASLMVAIIPYKWLAFLILVVLFKVAMNYFSRGNKP